MSEAIALYGLKNCDTCRKARAWLAQRWVNPHFIDLRQSPPTEALISGWAQRLGWQKLLNRRSQTWRALDEDSKGALDEVRAVALLTERPTLIKRPVIEIGHEELVVGFDLPARERLRLLLGLPLSA